jgi:hypothetical protein
MRSFLYLLLVSLVSLSQKAHSTSSDLSQDHAKDNNGLLPKRILIHPGQSDGSFVQLQALHEKYDSEFTSINHQVLSGLDEFPDSVTPQEGEHDTLGNETLVGSLHPSKTIPQEQNEDGEIDGEDDFGPSVDQYDPLEKRSELEEGTLEARHRNRCPASVYNFLRPTSLSSSNNSNTLIVWHLLTSLQATSSKCAVRMPRSDILQRQA